MNTPRKDKQMSRYLITDPSTGEVKREYATDSDEKVAAAVDSADAAYRSWGRTTTPAERCALMARVAALFGERREELAAMMSQEMGKTTEDALGEIDFAAAIYQYYADNGEAFLADEPIELMAGDGTAVIRRRPLGVLLGVMPWNFPAYQVARFAGPNLVVGNTILLKHASQCPASAAAYEEIFRAAGYPEGAYVNLYADTDQVQAVIADPRVQGVSLTGSERAGMAVAEAAGRNLKKVVLELGGSDPFIVMSTDDLDATVESAVAARLDNHGQSCNAAKRMIVHADLYDEFVARFTEKMLANGSLLLSSVGAAEGLEAQVAAAVAGGATLASSGERQGAFYPSGVLTGVTEANPVYRQELFGPVAMVFKAADEAEAVEIANDIPFGLGSYVFTTDPAQAQRIAERIDAGMVYVNGVLADGAELPFGGVKGSGFGRELGKLGIEEFINKKLVRVIA